MSAYYNEFDPKAAQWLRELIDAGLIAPGDVDERSISDVKPNDLAGYTQCHFFAGIGGWSLALRNSGVPDDYPVWTGSAPCQPFSTAGRQRGEADQRHLWPHWFHLIHECSPSEILGEQVASKDGLNWYDLVSSDLEGAGYATCAADMCAAGVGAPHIRQRLWFYGRRLADGHDTRQQGRLILPKRTDQRFVGENGVVVRMGDSNGTTVRWDTRTSDSPQSEMSNHGRQDRDYALSSSGLLWPNPTNGSWRNADWLYCRDDKWRPVEPGTFPLADGIPGRVGLLRGYGNAIVPEVAQAFIEVTLC